MTVFDCRALAVLVAFLALVPISRLEAKAGYGYKKAEDPLVLGIKRVILHARKGDWESCSKELERLSWQFEEFRQDLGVDIERDIVQSVHDRSIGALSRQVCRVMYFAVKQKFHWNQREKCEKYVPAKSRLEAAIYYYDEILAIGVRDFDRRAKKKIDAAIRREFETLRRSIGSAGLFGIGARKPDLKRFSKSAVSVLEHMRVAYPYLSRKPRKASESTKETKE